MPAREVERLQSAAADVGAQADELEAAAEKIERELGPIDVWANDAMVTVFSPFVEISPEAL